MARVTGFWKKIGDTIQPVFTSGVNLLIYGADRYLNFNSDTGSSGYGIRDNAGIIEFKNDSGAWTPIGSGGGSGSGHTIQDEGTPLTQRASLNFVGAGVTVTDDAGNNATVVTIPGGGGGGGISRTIVITTGDVTAGNAPDTDYVYKVAGNHVVTLPTAVSNANQYDIINLHSANISLATTSSQTIHGTAAPITLIPSQALTLQSDGSNWMIK